MSISYQYHTVVILRLKIRTIDPSVVYFFKALVYPATLSYNVWATKFLSSSGLFSVSGYKVWVFLLAMTLSV